MAKRKPNVILVLTDDQGYADLGCTGNPWIKTPNIDKFYEQGVRFNDFHVQPLCTPTRGALMTGRRPVRNGAWATCWGRSILRKDETTMADVFKTNGYHTGMFGKWHLGDNYPYRPFERGFDRTVAHQGGGVGQTPDFWGNNYFDDSYFHNGQVRKYEGYCTDIWFEQAFDFIDECGDKPFFAYIATNAPHCPYLVADKYAEPYRENPDIVQPEFYGMISNIDENFGKLMAKLDADALSDDTILIFMTDNGSSGAGKMDDNKFLEAGYNAGLRGMKGSYYDGGHKVPFIIRWANGNIVGGRDVDDLCLDIDILPTLIDVCEMKKNDCKTFDGRSFISLLKGETKQLADRVVFLNILQSNDQPLKERGCVMTRNWRLVHGEELYDIKNDPGQQYNVAVDYPEIVAQLKRELEEWWQEVAPGFEVQACISLGNDSENPTRLTAMDVMGDVAWHQTWIIKAKRSSGKWNVDVETPGRYRFSLRRWPEELPLAIDGMVSVECVASLIYGPGERKAIKPSKARVTIFDQETTTNVLPEHESAVLELDIKNTGETVLEACFIEKGEEYGAYYVIVERL